MSSDFLRRSQVLTTFGPGAMVDLPDRAVLIEGLQSWRFGDRREEIHEPRLADKIGRALALPEVRLVKPPAFDERPGAKRASIGARIFPTWFLVQEAVSSGPSGLWRRRRLVRWSELVNGCFRDDEGASRKPKKVVPVRFVCACPHGHLDDLDWRVYAHRGNGPSCGRRMWIEERGTSGDITETFVGCACGIRPRPLYEALGIDTRALGTCRGKRPWLGFGAEEECNLPYRLLVRSASNAYFPQLFSVISLPEEEDDPWIERLNEVWDDLAALASPADLPNARKFNKAVRQALDGLSDEEAWALIQERKRAGGEAMILPVKQAEFAMLDVPRGTRGADTASSPFHAEALDRSAWDTGHPFLRKVARVVLVHRLREVVAQVGFTRFEAVGPDEQGELDLGVASAALSPEPCWFPAIENRGEGVFMVLDAAAVEAWLAREPVKRRGTQLMRGFAAWQEENKGLKRPWLGLPFTMVHALSHLLLTRIALDAGYPAASLRERVYALPEQGMFGILLYTGTPDAEGTLGGLVEAGRRLGEHLVAAIESAWLCSSDPVCAEHDPSGAHDPLRLHGAACHACLMIAETSCEQRNDWLDRALVVPTVATPDAAFFAA